MLPIAIIFCHVQSTYYYNAIFNDGNLIVLTYGNDGNGGLDLDGYLVPDIPHPPYPEFAYNLTYRFPSKLIS